METDEFYPEWVSWIMQALELAKERFGELSRAYPFDPCEVEPAGAAMAGGATASEMEAPVWAYNRRKSEEIRADHRACRQIHVAYTIRDHGRTWCRVVTLARN